ncbi:MAG: septum site-determining protein MinC [Gammaproteobacteria bacterium]|nr:septum site-determining protein MinC [Gammaproteobacteria bacterium]
MEVGDDVVGVSEALDAHRELLQEKVALEIGERTPFEVVQRVAEKVLAAGGTLTDVRPPTNVLQARGETVIVARTVRSGGRVESTGSVVVLGDVNAGAEISPTTTSSSSERCAAWPHAGAGGNDKAVIWAERIRSPQLRIGSALAQAGADDAEDDDGGGPEVAYLKDDAIVIRPWHTN